MTARQQAMVEAAKGWVRMRAARPEASPAREQRRPMAEELIAAMAPGQWYSAGVLFRATGHDVTTIRVTLELLTWQGRLLERGGLWRERRLEWRRRD